MLTKKSEGKPNLVLSLRDGRQIDVSSYRGFVVVVGFLSKAACSTGATLELLDEIFLDVGPSTIRCFGCIVDLEPGETLREYSPFAIPIGAAPRRMVAGFLGVSMSGFYLPQFLIIDRHGRQRLRCIACGEDFWEVVRNFRMPVDNIVGEPFEEAAAAAVSEPEAVAVEPA